MRGKHAVLVHPRPDQACSFRSEAEAADGWAWLEPELHVVSTNYGQLLSALKSHLTPNIVPNKMPPGALAKQTRGLETYHRAWVSKKSFRCSGINLPCVC